MSLETASTPAQEPLMTTTSRQPPTAPPQDNDPRSPLTQKDADLSFPFDSDESGKAQPPPYTVRQDAPSPPPPPYTETPDTEQSPIDS